MSELFQHQKEGIAFLKENKKAILADEMGLGKTRQAIIAVGEESDKGILIICPASLKINWQREIGMVYPEDEVYVVHSGPWTPVEDAAWIVINYDMLPKYKATIMAKIEAGELGALILDEAHYIKGKSIRAEETLEISKNMEIVYCLTGTPVMNRPMELFNLLKAVGHPLSKGKTAYAKRYCGGQMKTIVHDMFNGRRFFVMPDKAYPFRMQKNRYKVYTFMDDTGATRLPELKEQIDSILLRRTKKEVLDLPEKIISTLYCELNNEWQLRYDTAWDQYIEWLENHPEGRNIDNILSAQQLVELMKLKQVCSQAKVERIVEDVVNMVDQEEKVIIFSQFTETINELMNGIGEDIKCVRLTGADDAEARQKAVDSFQNDPETKVFIANIKAGGVGLTLTAATIVVFADMEWSPEIHAQAEDRAHRIGQNGTVNVYYYIVKDTIEEDIKSILEGKKEIIGRLQGKLPTASLDNN